MIEIVTSTTADMSSDRLGEARQLLHVAFEGELSDEDWDHARGGWHVFAMDRGELVSHAAVVARTLEIDGRQFRTGYVEGVATLPDREREGLGSAIVAKIGQLIRSGFELGALSTDLYDFYGRLGWQRWRGQTLVRVGHEAIRTPSEDDNLMVLPLGKSESISLSGSISCESRPGDDW